MGGWGSQDFRGVKSEGTGDRTCSYCRKRSVYGFWNLAVETLNRFLLP